MIQELVIVTCRGKCGGRYIKVSPDVAQRWEEHPESFRCVLCHANDGRSKFNKYEKCSHCHQVCDPRMDDERSKCYCTQSYEKQLKFSIVHDPYNQWCKRDLHDMRNDFADENSKTDNLLRNKKFKTLLAEHEREIQDSKNLKIIADSMAKKNPKEKVKEYSGSAIQ